MKTTGAPASQPTTVPLRVRRPGSMDLDRAVLALGDLSWLGRPTDEAPSHPELRQVATDLDLPVLDGSSTGPIQKAAIIELGPAQWADGHLLVEIAWWSANLAPLFPVFAGEIAISTEDIVLDGRYAPPLGTLGLLLDRTLLHFVARRTAGALITRLVKEFETQGALPQ